MPTCNTPSLITIAIGQPCPKIWERKGGGWGGVKSSGEEGGNSAGYINAIQQGDADDDILQERELGDHRGNE